MRQFRWHVRFHYTTVVEEDEVASSRLANFTKQVFVLLGSLGCEFGAADLGEADARSPAGPV